MSSVPFRLLLVALAFAIGLCGRGAWAQSYEGYGFLDDPDQGEEFKIPNGQINTTVTARTSYHGVRIYDGTANQFIPQVSYDLAVIIAGIGTHDLGGPMNVNLDASGEWKYELVNGLSANATLTQGQYSARIESQLFIGGVSFADYNHAHSFWVKF